MTFTRRTALKGLGALAGAHFLPGCDNSGTSKPGPMVFMMMENRTYDHFLGARSMLEGKPGDGLTMDMVQPDLNGNLVGLRTAATTPEALCVLDPPHDWDASRVQWNGGKMDGFARAFQQTHGNNDGGTVMEYMTRDNLPVYYALADQYTSCDRWFASLLGPTLPNRLYWFTGQSNGARGNIEILNGAYKGLKSIFDRLDEKGITWAYYYGDISVLSFLPQFETDSRIKTYAHFMQDAKNGKLPQVVYIDPSFTFNDYHPPHYPLVAEQLIAATYNALATSPHWHNCTFVVTFDEHGGFHDHVAPPKTLDDRANEGFDQLGLRVPALVIGPHIKQGVCSTQFDHTSALRHLMNTYDLDSLALRDTAASDLGSTFDTLSKGTSPITLPTVEVDESTLDMCGGKSFDEHVMFDFAKARGLDITKAQRRGLDSVYDIADYLEKNNIGRLRRGR